MCGRVSSSDEYPPSCWRIAAAKTSCARVPREDNSRSRSKRPRRLGRAPPRLKVLARPAEGLCVRMPAHREQRRRRRAFVERRVVPSAQPRVPRRQLSSPLATPAPGWCMASNAETSAAARHTQGVIDKADNLHSAVGNASAAGVPVTPGVSNFAGVGFMAAEAIAVAAILQTVIIVRDALVNAKTNVRARAHPACVGSPGAAVRRWPRRRAAWILPVPGGAAWRWGALRGRRRAARKL